MKFFRHKMVWLGGGITCVLLMLAALISSYLSEPRHKGRRLSYWLAQYQRGNPRAEEAVLAIGPKAVPALLKMLIPPKHDLSVGGLLQSALGDRLLNDGTAIFEQRHLGAIGFEILGAQGASAIPSLVPILQDRDRAHYAWEALTAIGDPAIPIVEQFLTSTNPLAKRFAVFTAINMAGTNEPALVRFVTNADPAIRAEAYLAVVGHANRPGSKAYDYILAGLNDPDRVAASRAAIALRGLGDLGTNALGRLYELQNTTNGLLAAEVTSAIKSLEKRMRLRAREAKREEPEPPSFPGMQPSPSTKPL